MVQTAAAHAMTVLKEFHAEGDDNFVTDSEFETKDIEHETAEKQDEKQSLNLKRDDLCGGPWPEALKELEAALARHSRAGPL